MSNENECPFKLGQWVTDGERCKRVLPWFYDEPRRLTVGLRDKRTHPDDVDWSRWVAFDPANVAEYSCELAALESERDETEAEIAALKARVAELEKLAGRLNWDLHDAERRAEKAEARVVELTPPEGYVAVFLPRDTAHALGHLGADWVSAELRANCRRALEADDE